MPAKRALPLGYLGLALLGLGYCLACSSGSSPGDGPSGQSGGQSGGMPPNGGSAGNPSSGGKSGSGPAGAAGAAGAPAAGSGGTPGTGGASAGTPGNGGAGTSGSGTAGAGMGGAGSGGASGGSSGASGASGGSGGDSSSGGSAGDGAGGTAGASGDAYSGTIIVTDAFDTGDNGAQPDPAKWAAYGEFEQGSPVLDSARSHSPPNSARATPSAGGGLGSFLVPASTLPNKLPAPENRFYVRVWMSWEKATPEVSGHGGFIVGASSRDNSGTEARLGISNPGFAPILDMNLQNPMDGGGGEVTRFSNGYTTGGNPGEYPQMGFQFEATRWYCVEVLFNGGGHEFQVWVDDVEVPNMHITDFGTNAPRTMWSPSYAFLKIGGQDYGSQLGSIWYDDVFVGTEPIGCARPVP
jgi:hypothetical protein